MADYDPYKSEPKQQTITYIITTERQKKSDDTSAGCGCLVLLLAAIALAVAGINFATGHGDRVLRFLAMDRPGYGVHVCTLEHYAIDRVECDKESSTIPDLSAARLAVSSENTLVSNTLTLILYQLPDMTKLCETDFTSSPGANNIAVHLDQVIAQCGAHLSSHTDYEIDVLQDTESLGSTTFTYQP